MTIDAIEKRRVQLLQEISALNSGGTPYLKKKRRHVEIYAELSKLKAQQKEVSRKHDAKRNETPNKLLHRRLKSLQLAIKLALGEPMLHSLMSDASEIFNDKTSNLTGIFGGNFDESDE